jgi:hypothetical protein
MEFFDNSLTFLDFDVNWIGVNTQRRSMDFLVRRFAQAFIDIIRTWRRTKKWKYIEKENMFRTNRGQFLNWAFWLRREMRRVRNLQLRILKAETWSTWSGLGIVSYKFKSVSEIESDNETTVSEALQGLPRATNPRKLNSSMLLVRLSVSKSTGTLTTFGSGKLNTVPGVYTIHYTVYSVRCIELLFSAYLVSRYW